MKREFKNGQKVKWRVAKFPYLDDPCPWTELSEAETNEFTGTIVGGKRLFFGFGQWRYEIRMESGKLAKVNGEDVRMA